MTTNPLKIRWNGANEVAELRKEVDRWAQKVFKSQDPLVKVEALVDVLNANQDLRTELAKTLNWLQPEDTSFDLILLAFGAIQRGEEDSIRGIFSEVFGDCSKWETSGRLTIVTSWRNCSKAIHC